ncbi:iron-sulfur cluster assembly accessory protein [Deinococcus sp.]|uniref:HesB/IscA family protein n=1 Tax=Deinococcus sp. TaxID=47478 RepID=UPI0025E7A4B8|nr:iron-sulfur cluster assembly accessory protein [Deinococcus sp.]
MTSAALEEIRRLGGTLRVGLEAGGCCGASYMFGLRGQPGDLWFTDADLTLCLSPDALLILSGARLDYGARIKPPRFRVLANPNTPQRCACNRSFGLPFPGKATPQCRAYEPMPWQSRSEQL